MANGGAHAHAHARPRPAARAAGGRAGARALAAAACVVAAAAEAARRFETDADFWAGTAREADAKFVATCQGKGGRLRTYTHALKGAEGEDLHSRVCLAGPRDAPNVLYALTGVHGAEGLTGSYSMLQWLHGMTTEGGEYQLPANTRYVFHHLVEPWGASHGYKENENNVDQLKNLNELFREVPGWDRENDIMVELVDAIDIPTLDTQYLQDAEGFAERTAGLMPSLINKYGPDKFTKALLKGQMRRQVGISYWGTEDSWATTVLKNVAADYLAGAERIMLLDLHTAVGELGRWTMYAYDRKSEAEFQRWIAESGSTRVMENLNKAGVSLDPWPFYSYIERLVPDAHVLRVVWEAGTFPQDAYQVYLMFGMHCRFYNETTQFPPEMCRAFNHKIREYFYPAVTEEFRAPYRGNVSEDNRDASRVLFHGLHAWSKLPRQSKDAGSATGAPSSLNKQRETPWTPALVDLSISLLCIAVALMSVLVVGVRRILAARGTEHTVELASSRGSSRMSANPLALRSGA